RHGVLVGRSAFIGLGIFIRLAALNGIRPLIRLYVLVAGFPLLEFGQLGLLILSQQAPHFLLDLFDNRPALDVQLFQLGRFVVLQAERLLPGLADLFLVLAFGLGFPHGFGLCLAALFRYDR